MMFLSLAECFLWCRFWSAAQSNMGGTVGIWRQCTVCHAHVFAVLLQKKKKLKSCNYGHFCVTVESTSTDRLCLQRTWTIFKRLLEFPVTYSPFKLLQIQEYMWKVVYQLGAKIFACSMHLYIYGGPALNTNVILAPFNLN